MNKIYLLKQLEEAAKAENWGFVDTHIKEVVGEKEAIDRAKDLLLNRDPNLRDLGASIFERAKQIDQIARSRLGVLVRSKKPGYDTFRSACALAAHDYREIGVKEVLERFKSDPDSEVSSIAEDYLKRVYG